MMTFPLFAPATTRWLRWRKDRKSRRDRLGRFCDIYCTVLLRYSFALRVISDILGSNCFESYGPKDTSQAQTKFLDAYNCVYITLKWKVCQIRVHKSLIRNLARQSFSLFDRNKTQRQTSKTSESTVSLSLEVQKFADNQILCWLVPCLQMSFRYKV